MPREHAVTTSVHQDCRTHLGGAAVLAVGLALAVSTAIGCASRSERHAFDVWTSVDASLYDGRRSDSVANVAGMPSTHTDDEIPGDAGLDDFVRFAVRHHPRLEAAFYRWRAALERVPQARSLPDPQATFGVVLDQVDESTQYMGERYAISQMFPWFGTLDLRENIALEEAKAEAQRFEIERLQLIERVVQAYVEYAYIHHAVAIARDSVQLMTSVEAVTRSRFRASTATLYDVDRAQIEVARLDEQVQSMSDLLRTSAADLNTAIGRRADAPLPSPAELPSVVPLIPLPDQRDEQWLLLARQFNPGLMAARHDAASRRHAIALARKSDRPDITLGVEYARGGSGRMAMRDGGGEDMMMAMVSFSLPIWGDKVDAEIQEALARHAQAARDLADQTYSVESAMLRSLFAYRDSGRKLDLYSATLLPKARQSLAALESAYRVDKASFSDVLEAQQSLLEFELAYERAAADRLEALARIWTTIGGSDKVPSIQTSDTDASKQQSTALQPAASNSAGGHP